jgi:hypothetical protein
MEASPRNEMDVPARIRKKISKRVGIIILSVIVIALIIVGSIIVYSMPKGPGPDYITLNPMIIADKGYIVNHYHYWTINHYVGSADRLLKNDIYVWLKNESGFIIIAEPLTSASGTHGFEYVAIDSGNNVSFGDSFRLSSDYAVGSKIYLGNEAASGNYAILKV